MKCIAYLINIIALLGAVNWLLIGLARIDIISFLFGQMNMASRVAYIVLGLATLIQLCTFCFKSLCEKKCA